MLHLLQQQNASLQIRSKTFAHLHGHLGWVALILKGQEIRSFEAVIAHLKLNEQSVCDIADSLHTVTTNLHDIGQRIVRSCPQCCLQRLSLHHIQIALFHKPNRVGRCFAHSPVIQQYGEHRFLQVQLLEHTRSIEWLIGDELVDIRRERQLIIHDPAITNLIWGFESISASHGLSIQREPSTGVVDHLQCLCALNHYCHSRPI